MADARTRGKGAERELAQSFFFPFPVVVRAVVAGARVVAVRVVTAEIDGGEADAVVAGLAGCSGTGNSPPCAARAATINAAMIVAKTAAITDRPRRCGRPASVSATMATVGAGGGRDDRGLFVRDRSSACAIAAALE